MAKQRASFTLVALYICTLTCFVVAQSKNERVRLARAAMDQTSFIVKFSDGIAAPVSTAALTADTDEDHEKVRALAQQLSTAATHAAGRLVQIAKKQGITVEVLDTYGHVMTGMAVRVATPEEGLRLAELLRSDAAVQAVQPVVTYQADLDRLRPTGNAAAAAADATLEAASEPALADPQVWGGADHSTLVDLAQSHYSGAGIRIAVVDDGIDYTHPAFGGCTAIGSGNGCRVVAGHDFTDGDAKTYDLCASHGTHVAGIIAGDTTSTRTRTVPWRGVAYQAELGAYRVFDCSGMTRNSWLLSALEQAVKDGMNIINLSMGTSWTAPLGVKFVSRLARQGVMVAAAVGNSGQDGLWTYGAPSSEPDSFAVGSTDNTYSLGAALTVDTNITVRGETTSVLAATVRAMMNNPMFSIPRELVLPQPKGACGRIQNKDAVAGKVALVPLGGCSEEYKASSLIAAGAASVIFYDNHPFPAFKQSLNIDASIGAKAPQMFVIGQDTGTAVAKLLQQGRAVCLTKVAAHRYLNPNADQPSAFSSWGPDTELRMLPTVSAPGGGLLSSIPGTNFALYQGTSMATPYVAGALALWRHAHSNRLRNSSRDMLDEAKAACISTAMPIKYAGDESFAHSVVQAGAGMIQVNAAIHNAVRIRPTYLPLPTGKTETVSIITLTNGGSHAVSYQLGHTPAVAVSTEHGWYETEQQLKLAASVKFTECFGSNEITTLDLQPHGTVKVKAVITIPDEMQVIPMFYSGYLTLTPIQRVDAADWNEVTQADSTPSRRMLQASSTGNGDAAAAAAYSMHVHMQGDSPWFPPLSIPYLSLSQKYSSLTALAAPRADDPDGQHLRPGSAYLCSVADGRCATKPEVQIGVDMQSLEQAACTFAVPLSRPVGGAYIEVYDAAEDKLLGTFEFNEYIPWGGPRTWMQLPEGVTGAYWTGEYTPTGSNSSEASGKITLGDYKFVLVLTKPVALADQPAASAAEYLEKVQVMGRLRVSRQRRGSEDDGWVPIGRH